MTPRDQRSIMAPLALALAIVPGGCSAGVSGEVRSSQTSAPVDGAVVQVRTSRWGRSNGTIVWDKPSIHSARTDAQGKFAIGVDGGYQLTVRAPGYRTVVAPLCSQSPMIVRIDGSLSRDDLRYNMRLDLGPEGSRGGWTFAGRGSEAELAKSGLSVAGPVGRSSEHRLLAPFGAAFVEGTGDPPPAPRSGYRNALALDLLHCGWIYVRTQSGSTAIVEIGNYEIAANRNGSDQLRLSYVLVEPS